MEELGCMGTQRQNECACSAFSRASGLTSGHFLVTGYAPINSKLQHPPPGIPRAFDCASFPGRGEFERCVGRVGNLNRIYLLF